MEALERVAAGRLPRTVDLPRARALAARAAAAQAAVACPLPTSGLSVRLESLDGRVQQLDADHPSGTLPLGDRVTATALWREPSGAETPVRVTWGFETVPPSGKKRNVHPTWRRDHPPEPGSAKYVFFPEDVVLLFEGAAPDPVSERRLAAVHTGTAGIVVRLAAADAPDGADHELTLSLEVRREGVRLGNADNQYDDLILRFANAYGYPPQVLKGLLAHESADWNPWQYRYEPAAWDYGQGLRHAVRRSLGNPYHAPFRFEEPATSGVGAWSRGTHLTTSDIDGRIHPSPGRFKMFAAEWEPRSGSYICKDMSQLAGQPVSAWALYLGSNGVWMGPKDPNNKLSPCGRRLRWDVGVDIYDWVRNPPPKNPPGADDATWWFYRHPDYIAQTFLAASYGLGQIGYATTAFNLKWRQGQPGARGWADIVDPANNIYLAARWLAWRESRPGRYISHVKATEPVARVSEAQLDILVELTLCGYNGGAAWTCGYAAKVLRKAAPYTPTGGATP